MVLLWTAWFKWSLWYHFSTQNLMPYNFWLRGLAKIAILKNGLFWFLAFLGVFWRFWPRKDHIRPFHPWVWGGHKNDTKSISLLNNEIEFWAIFAQRTHSMMTKKHSSRDKLKMIVGVSEIFWCKKFWPKHLLRGSFWPPKENYVYGHTQKICPTFFDFFSIFGKFMNWALIYGCGFGSYL